MAISSWHGKPAEIEIDRGLARETKSRKNLSPPPIHSSMSERTDTSIGAPPRGTPPDASSSSPLPTAPERQHGAKVLPVPKCHDGTPSRPDRGQYDPGSAFKVVGEAVLSGSSRLPESTTEET